MKILLKSLSVLVYSIPVDILIVGSCIKGIEFKDAGAMLFGMIILLIGGLYVWFGAKKENKLPLGCVVVGLVICICSFIALIIGLCFVSSPVGYLGGRKLWQISNKK